MARQFTYREIRDIWREDFDPDTFDAELLDTDEDGDGGRWTNYMTITFRFEDKFYQAGFEVDACEASEGNGTFDLQTNMDVEYDCVWQVEKRLVIREEWVPIDAN